MGVGGEWRGLRGSGGGGRGGVAPHVGICLERGVRVSTLNASLNKAALCANVRVNDVPGCVLEQI